jgi:hypothetical protein
MTSRLTPEDTTYVLHHFSTLEELCRGRAGGAEGGRAPIASGLLPGPSYVLDDGTEMFARDLWTLVDAAGSPGAVQEHFVGRYDLAAKAVGVSLTHEAIDEVWRGYLTGDFGVCLRDVTPENIFAKERLVTSLTELTLRPEPATTAWCLQVRDEVDALDRLEKPFTAFDRQRFGRPVSRETLIDGVRARYSHIFA